MSPVQFLRSFHIPKLVQPFEELRHKLAKRRHFAVLYPMFLEHFFESWIHGREVGVRDAGYHVVDRLHVQATGYEVPPVAVDAEVACVRNLLADPPAHHGIRVYCFLQVLVRELQKLLRATAFEPRDLVRVDTGHPLAQAQICICLHILHARLVNVRPLREDQERPRRDENHRREEHHVLKRPQYPHARHQPQHLQRQLGRHWPPEVFHQRLEMPALPVPKCHLVLLLDVFIKRADKNWDAE
mmetsp:Transcript_28323/g.71904  ORF Transcript_28323/g.71904 Transcript_28323/m.71904 type:complete len:242 (-) Transcript_28323:3466-4191(-)